MTITILGATGFVGSALARRLEETGEHVVKLNRPDFDLTLPSTFSKIPNGTDVLVHAAGHVGSARVDDVLWATNVKATYYLANHLITHRLPRRVIYLSSGAVYGMQSQVVTHSSALHPDSLYGVSKLLAERIMETMLRSHVVIARLFFPFGPGQKLPRLVPSLIQRIAHGEIIEINTLAGLPIINPIYIYDLVEQLIQILYQPQQGCYNLGGSIALSVRQIAETIARYFGSAPNFIITEKPTGNLVCKPDLPETGSGMFEDRMATTIQSLLADRKE